MTDLDPEAMRDLADMEAMRAKDEGRWPPRKPTDLEQIRERAYGGMGEYYSSTEARDDIRDLLALVDRYRGALEDVERQCREFDDSDPYFIGEIAREALKDERP